MNSNLFTRAIRVFSMIISSIVIIGSVSSCGILRTYADHYSTSFCYKGQWSSWENHYFPTSSYMRDYDDWRIYSIESPEKDIIGLRLEDRGGNTYYGFKITNYTRGKGTYEGIVEYYVNDTYPTAEALARANTFIIPNFRTDETPSVKRKARATIKIINEEKKPAVFNIWYDNIGVGFDVRNVYWHH